MRGTTIDLRAAIAGLAMVALLGLAACGDDDDGGAVVGAPGGAEQGQDGRSGGAGGGGPGACDLLEKAEVEQQFGDLGAVAEGETTSLGCSWEVGEQVEGAPVPQALTLQILSSGGSPGELLAEVRSHEGVVEVPGLADEAVFDFGALYVRSGEVLVGLAAYTIPGVDLGSDALQGQLVALAEPVVSRL
jgi:hypothetical protein